MAREIAIQHPECQYRKECDIDQVNIRMGGGQNKDGACQRDTPSFDKKRVPCHARDDCLNHLQVELFIFHRGCLQRFSFSNNTPFPSSPRGNNLSPPFLVEDSSR